ncbi:MAG TPA: hypothetical protein VKU87_11995 [Thermomicrobiaceae bacterium]|nr:hypothetical protein [Thermomicrobiaceae bacterium]
MDRAKRYIVGFGMFWYHFVVGDDWTIAAAVVVGLIVTALVAHNGGKDWVWFLMPLAAVAILGASVWRASRAA